MSKPKYEDYIRRELEDNNGLTTQERMELLKILGKIEGKKLENARLRIKHKTGRHYGPLNKPKPLVDLPPAIDEPPAAKPMGQAVDEALAEYQKDLKERHDGSGEQHQHSGQVGHEQEGTAGGEPGA